VTSTAWQPTLLELDPARHGDRRQLGDGAWVDFEPGWCPAPGALFTRLLAQTPWDPPRRVRMYDREVVEPRRTHRWTLDDAPADLAAMARTLSRRYDVEFTQVGANLYRDGNDAVAWHGDRVARELPSAVVALISLGAVRPLRLRPRGGGASVTFRPGPGDLLVMGGTCQRTWQHAVPRAPAVGPRISVQFRHAYPR
jgi:alkylated DNA repair dioxygenase AlkB